MKILIISGFLGAGKTTFIKALSKNTGREFAILENEYGSAGIDGDILRADLVGDNPVGSTIGGKVNIWELTEGCICCSTKEDFAASVLTIANAVAPEYLVVEPTGVAMLSQIIHKLKQIEYERITLLAPIAIVDGHSCDRYSREYPDLYRDQICHAHTVFVSKMEHASPQELEHLDEKLKEISPHSRIITKHYSLLDKSQWLALLKHGYDGRLLQEKDPSAPPQFLPDTFSMKGVSLKTPEHLLLLMEALIHGECGNVFRAKGQVYAGGQFFRFDLADGQYSITGSTPLKQQKATGTSNTLDDAEVAEEKVVFIGTDLARQKIRRFFLQPPSPPPEEIRLLGRGKIVL